MYRTSGVVTEEIVLERRSRPRVRLIWVFVLGALFASLAVMVEVGAREHGPTTYVAAAALFVVAVFVVFVRTRKLTVARVGRELRIREGRKRESVLVGEVREVEIDTRGEKVHAVVLVLEGNRRLALGDPFERMSDAVAERKTLRNALTRP